ncbi:hypothetical protein QFC19_002847 [Naganishia cerealis]|uniref:Uncharacterized protein n=1 Tax=Naganishia cerealis TaxID=610337 RepID=A0ACC2W7V6_9TREE|nr:hypothetical protein QFC19_002847 [Naganishia cerealis]
MFTAKDVYIPPPSPSYGPRTPSRLRFKSTTPSSSTSHIGPARHHLNSFEEEESDQVAGYHVSRDGEDDTRQSMGSREIRGARGGSLDSVPSSSRIGMGNTTPGRSRRNDGASGSGGTPFSPGGTIISSPINFRHVAGSGITGDDMVGISPTRITHQQYTDNNMFRPESSHPSSSLPSIRQMHENIAVSSHPSGPDEFGRIPGTGLATAHTWSSSSSGPSERVAVDRMQITTSTYAGRGTTVNEDSLLVLGSPLSPIAQGLEQPLKQQRQQQRYRSESPHDLSSALHNTTFSEESPPGAVAWSQSPPCGNDMQSPISHAIRSTSSSVSGPSGLPSGASTQIHTPRTPNPMISPSAVPPHATAAKYTADVSHLRQQSLGSQGPSTIPITGGGARARPMLPPPPSSSSSRFPAARPRGSSEVVGDKDKRKAGWFANVASTIGGVGRRHSEEGDRETPMAAAVGGGQEGAPGWGSTARFTRRGSSSFDDSAVTEEEVDDGAGRGANDYSVSGQPPIRKKSITRMRSLVVGNKQPRTATAEEGVATGGGEQGGGGSSSSLGSFLRKHSFSSSASRRPNMQRLAAGSGDAQSVPPPQAVSADLQISAPIGVTTKATVNEVMRGLRDLNGLATDSGQVGVTMEQGNPQRGEGEEAYSSGNTARSMQPRSSHTVVPSTPSRKETDTAPPARPTTPTYIRQTPGQPVSPVSSAVPRTTSTQPGFPTPLSPPRRVNTDDNSIWSTPRANSKRHAALIPSTPSDSSHLLENSSACYPSRTEHAEHGALLMNTKSVRNDYTPARDCLPSTPQRSNVHVRPGRIIPPPLSLHQALGASLSRPYELASGADADTEDTEDQSSILDYDDVVIERAERVMTPTRVRKESRNRTPEPPPTPSDRLMPSPMTFSDLGTQQLVDISVSCRANDNTGNASDDYEEFSWNVVIRRKKVPRDSVPVAGSTSASTSPLQLSDTPTHAIVPSTASSINLSLNLHQPAGKLVFISVPPVTEVPSHRRKTSHSAVYGPSITKLASARVDERSPSPSPASSRQFSSRGGLLSPRLTSSPSTRTKTSYNKAASAPTPSESDESHEEVHRSSESASTTPGRAYPAGEQIHAVSPPASPRDLMMRRRKASLQGGVLYTRGL